jgi:hypothetical protein
VTEDNDLDPFRYEELKSQNEIRLIQSLPGEESAEIECNLFRIVLGEARRIYAALSYVWDDPSVAEEIAVNSSQLSSNYKSCFRHLSCSTLDTK